MAECDRLKTCPFFSGQMASMPAVTGLLKETYCLGDMTKCARYQVVTLGIPAPLDLFPHERHRAQEIIWEAKSKQQN